MNAGTLVQTVETLVIERCCKCGVPFGMMSGFQRDRLQDRCDFYCPNGHPQRYVGKTEADRLRDELEAANRRTADARNWAQREQNRAQVSARQAAAARGQVTRIKRRVAKGICPCCNHSFADLARHMAGQHPDWSAEPQP